MTLINEEAREERKSKEFLERMALIEAQKAIDEIKHKFKMEELEYERATTHTIHEQILERGRIQRAEDRKTLMLKDRLYKRK